MPKVFAGSYELHFAISDDIASGWIYVETRNTDLQELLDAHRPVAKVCYNKAVVYSEVLFADTYDRERFDEFYGKHNLTQITLTRGERVFINHWYRNKLGIKNLPAGSLLDISFKFNPGLVGESWYQANACMAHPQVIVRVATWVGLVALGLGAFGAGLALLPLADEHALLSSCPVVVRVLGSVLCGGGLIEIVWSTILFARSRRHA